MISKTSTQMINALVELAKLPEGEFEGAKSIAQRIKAPQNYLGKMLQYLCIHKIVISRKGLGGGFRLGRDPKAISLYEIVEPIENVSVWSECALGLKKCSETHPCAVHHRWKAVRATYYDFLRKTTVADLVK
jgi:Rrf2 family transcriptional regulator, iron-sulfur cluster assembly transcription factor